MCVSGLYCTSGPPQLDSCACRAFVLPLADVIRHLWGDPMFARFAGTRTLAMLECPLYSRLDLAHGGAISALAQSDCAIRDPIIIPEGGGPAPAVHGPPQPAQDGGGPAAAARRPPVPAQDGGGPAAAAHEPAEESDLDAVEDPDPSDDHMTAHGKSMIMLFGLFVDGVQLHGHGRHTTTVFVLKCLDLPGFLVNTDLAAYTLAYIEGPKEPTCMTEILMTVLKQFKIFEPSGVEHGDGASPAAAIRVPACVPCCPHGCMSSLCASARGGCEVAVVGDGLPRWSVCREDYSHRTADPRP